MGNSASAPQPTQASDSAGPQPASASAAQGPPNMSGCPVSDPAARAKFVAGVGPTNPARPPSAPLPNGCPMSDKTNEQQAQETLVCKSGTEGDAAELDPKNLMYPENQRPHPSQEQPLSVTRQVSSIPQAGSAKNWVYPSPQMFYNAMKKKGWDPKEHDMDVVVAIHNNVNERAWQKVMAWESLHSDECSSPQLLKFCGRPTDLSPKARFKTWLGREAPFDRHDWIVDRCGREVRYVIDFYAYDPGNGLPPTTLIDARPAIDSFEAFLDRFRMRYWVVRQKYFPVTPSAEQTNAQQQQQQAQPSPSA